MNTDDMTMIEALTTLHEETNRQGPGDDSFSLEILRRLPELPSACVIADLGCGTGVASLLLAREFQQEILCVDTSEAFLLALTRKAESAGLGHLVTTLCADMGSLDPEEHRIDLLWSEGAAYNLTFEGAMRKWRPLMAENGIAVVSELSWFGSDRPLEVEDYWNAAYPEMADEQSNIESAERHGFELHFTERLPSDAWWKNYYNPLSNRLDALADSPSRTLQEAILETRQEIELFRKYSVYFGYSFYALKAV